MKGGVAIPRSSATVKAITDASGDRAKILCGACEKFLVEMKREADGAIQIERKCWRAHCNALSRGRVTARPGDPLANGLSGQWGCGRCGGHLGAVDEVRGRVILRCPRCRTESRVTGTDALLAAYPLDNALARSS